MDFVSFRREKKSIFFPLHRGVCGPPSACYLLGSQSRQIVKSFLLPQDLPSLLPRILLPTLLLILYLNICILFYFSSSLPFFLSWKTFTQILIRRWGRENQPVTWGSVTPSRQEWRSFPYPPGQCEGAQGMTCDLPLTTQVTLSVKSPLYLWATCGLGEGAAFQSVRGRLLCPPFWRHSQDSGCWSIIFWPLLMAF